MLSRVFWSRHAWKGLIALVALLGVFAGIGDISDGLDADPAIRIAVTGQSPDEIRETSAPLARMIDAQTRVGGVHILMLCLLWGVIAVIPFRGREPWAWYAMWTLPAWGALMAVSFWFVDLVPDGPIPPPAISGWVLFVVGSLLLLASVDLVRRTGDREPSSSATGSPEPSP